MKKLIIFLLTNVFIIASIFAQNKIPNGGFEHWSAAGQGEDPDSLWYSVNQLTNSITFPILVSKSTDAFAGNYALYIRSDTATLPPPAGNNTLDTLSGFVGLNFNFSQGNSLGIPFSGRPNCISVYIKANIPTGDTSSIIVTLTNTNGIVGETTIFIAENVASYTSYVVPINYLNAQTPEFLAITVFAGDGELPLQNAQSNLHPLPDNEIWVDEMKFIYESDCTTSISDFGMEDKIHIYPSPAQNFIAIETVLNEHSDIYVDIFDLTGKKIFQTNLNKEKTVVDISFLNSGLYFLTVYSKKQGIQKTFRFTKTK